MTPIASLSIPHFRQEQDASCTAACVRMVLAYYGRTHSEDELRDRRCRSTARRSSPSRSRGGSVFGWRRWRGKPPLSRTVPSQMHLKDALNYVKTNGVAMLRAPC